MSNLATGGTGTIRSVGDFSYGVAFTLGVIGTHLGAVAAIVAMLAALTGYAPWPA